MARRSEPGGCVLLDQDLVLLSADSVGSGWTWATFHFAHARHWQARVFPSRRAALRARRSYGPRGPWLRVASIR